MGASDANETHRSRRADAQQLTEPPPGYRTPVADPAVWRRPSRRAAAGRSQATIDPVGIDRRGRSNDRLRRSAQADDGACTLRRSIGEATARPPCRCTDSTFRSPCRCCALPRRALVRERRRRSGPTVSALHPRQRPRRGGDPRSPRAGRHPHGLVPGRLRRRPPGKSGIAHFLEHLMFKGTAKHPAGRILARWSSASAARRTPSPPTTTPPISSASPREHSRP